MKIRKFTAAALATATALALAACSTPADDDDDSGDAGGGTVTVGWNQPFYSYNENTSNGNATANAIIKYMMNTGFNYYDENQELVQDESFGTYEKTSDDPLTVTYTINDGVAWSDGTPVDAADMLMVWAGQSTNLNTVDAGVERDPDTNVPKTDGVFFDSTSAGLELVTQTPEISEDGKSLTLVYDEPFADWELDMGLNTIVVPAHVTTMRALDIDDPQEGKDAFIAAVNDNDKKALSKIAAFWNSGYDYKSLPDDDMLYLSNGAYLMTDFVENQYITLKANPDYTGDRPAGIETVTVRWNEDPMAQVQALENGELDLFGPQATTDVVDAVEAVDGVEMETGVEGTYEHIDLVFDNGGPFDPKTYGGDAEKAKLVRQAFLLAYPRQEIVEKLIVPLQADAEIRNSFIITPGAPGYDETVASNGMAEITQDIDGAKALLAEAGVKAPSVRIMFAEDNIRRENEFDIVKPALEEAGFKVVDARNIDWGSKLGDGTYDAVFFGWQSTSTAVTESQATFGTGGLNNLVGYSNKAVDGLFDQLKVETDPAAQVQIQADIDKILVEDAVGLTLFQFPSVAAWNSSRIEGVQPAPLSPTIFYGYWNWSVPS